MPDTLYESASAVANGSGVALAQLGPFRAFEKWQVTSCTVQSDSVSPPKASIYRGSAAPSRLINGTYSGQFDTDPQFNLLLQSGEVMVVVWEGADAGSHCTVTVQGERLGRS